MKKRLIFVGKSASGKDYARMTCEQWFGMTYQVSYTTRPPREGETDGKDYIFLSRNEAIDMVKRGLFYEYVEFNGWLYGTTKEQFYTEDSVFIMTPSGLSHLSAEDRAESLVVYLDMPVEIRKNRMQERKNDDDSINRRLEADHIDFIVFENYDVMITDPYFSIVDLYQCVSSHFSLPNKDTRIADFDNSLTKVYNLSTK